MLGSEYYDKKTKGFSASGSGAPPDDFADLNLTDNGKGNAQLIHGIASTVFFLILVV
ncbi:hypothetical protein NXX68_00145 [Bacteroides fragilis]|nr:hypothetical protein [Bacteroides fragilis]